MIVYDKKEIREALTLDNIIDVIQEFGGDPMITSFGLIPATICHNPPGEGSHKLYFYNNSKLFHCYTGCEEPNFDIFELVIKVMEIQRNEDFDLNDAVRWIAKKFGFIGREEDAPATEQLEDWQIIAAYDRVKEIDYQTAEITLKEYNDDILDRFNYKVKIKPWLDEGIDPHVMDESIIGYYPGGEQITIPHFDCGGRLIGIRGRTLIEEEGERFGKYRPLKVNGQLYNHPLGLNLYNLNRVKDNIKTLGSAIVYEGEKSALKYRSYVGTENDISVACCGSNLTAYQVQLLIEAGAKEIIVAFDRQFQEIGDEEFLHLKKNLLKLNEKYKKDALISFIFDKEKITPYKSSPIDCTWEIFMKLYKERIII